MLLYRLLKYNVLLYYRFTHNCTNVWQHCLERTASVAGKNLCFLPGPARQLLPSYTYSVSYFHKKSTILGSLPPFKVENQHDTSVKSFSRKFS